SFGGRRRRMREGDGGGWSSATPNERPPMIRLRRGSRSSPSIRTVFLLRLLMSDVSTSLDMTITFSELLAESNRPANQDSRRLRDTLGAILRKSSHADCCKIHRRSASAHASTPPP